EPWMRHDELRGIDHAVVPREHVEIDRPRTEPCFALAIAAELLLDLEQRRDQLAGCRRGRHRDRDRGVEIRRLRRPDRRAAIQARAAHRTERRERLARATKALDDRLAPADVAAEPDDDHRRAPTG